MFFTRAGIIAALTPMDLSHVLLQDLAESFSAVGVLLSVCPTALFMKLVKM